MSQALSVRGKTATSADMLENVVVVTAAPEMIEHNQIAAKESVRNRFGHRSDALGIVLPPFAIIRHLRDAVQVINELIN